MNRTQAMFRALQMLLLGVLATSALAQTGPADPNNYSRSVSYTYRADGRVETETIEPDRLDQCVKTTHTYDSYGNRSGSTAEFCTGALTAARFLSRSSSTVFAAQTTPNAAPAGVFPTTLSNALGHEEKQVRDPATGQMVQLTGPNLLDTRWSLDALGRAIQETRADGTRTSTIYCYLADRISDTSSNSAGCITPAASEIPSGALMYVQSEQRNAADGKIGPFTRSYLDRMGRKIRSVQEAFDGTDQVGGTSRLVAQDWEYNAYGVLTTTTQAYFLDSNSSNAVGSSDYGMSMSQVDVLGRPVVVYTSDSQGSQPGVTFGARGTRKAARTSITYSGLTTTYTNDKSDTRTEERTVDGRIARVTDAKGAQLAHQYDAFGLLVATRDALNNRIRVGYDYRGRKLSLNDPDSGITGYCYDALGQLKAQQSANLRGSSGLAACPTDTGTTTTAVVLSAWTTMAYDVLGRQTERIETENKSTWTYDQYAAGTTGTCSTAKGKLCEVKNTNGLNRKFTYDTVGRPSSALMSATGGASMASAVSYDANGRLDTRTYPSGLRVQYAYTAKGYVKSVNLASALNLTPLPATAGGAAAAPAVLASGTVLWEARSLHASGRSESQKYGNGVFDRTTFDAYSGRQIGATAGKDAATNVVSHQYGWDSLGHLTSRTDDNGDIAGIYSGAAVTENFLYDPVGRLKSYTVAAPALAPSLTRSVILQYNALGMLLYKSDVGTYTYNTQGGTRAHALQSLRNTVGTDTGYFYDANGNLTTADAGAYRTIAPSSFNLPTSATGPAGSYSWLYDENHQRVKETRTKAGESRVTWSLHPDAAGGLGFEREVLNGTESTANNRHYVSAGGATVAVIVTSGALPALVPAGTTVPPYQATLTAAKLEYWHQDHLGSLVATTDHVGTLTARYAYDPFGKRRYANGRYDDLGNLVIDWTTNTNQGTDRGFTGHEHLDDIGLVHMNGRLFDPMTGRFISPDPVINAPYGLQSYERYAYVENNPLGSTDPTGFTPGDCEGSCTKSGNETSELPPVTVSGQATWNPRLDLGRSIEAGALILTDSNGVSVAFAVARQKTIQTGTNFLKTTFKLVRLGLVGAATTAAAPIETFVMLLAMPSNIGNEARDDMMTDSRRADVEKKAQEALAADTMGTPGGPDPDDDDEKNKAKKMRGQEAALDEHKKKLAQYLRDPESMDNKGFLKNASPEVRDAIIQGRIRSLENTIRNVERQIEILKGKP